MLVLGSARARALPSIEKVLVDSAYKGKLAQWVSDELGWHVEVVSKDATGQWFATSASIEPQPGFQLLKWRWIVERTFAWIGRYRRLSKDYEASCESSQTWMLCSLVSILLRRLAPP